MKRRTFLATGALAGGLSTGGCLSRFGIGGDTESDDHDDDGYEADDDDAYTDAEEDDGDGDAVDADHEDDNTDEREDDDDSTDNEDDDEEEEEDNEDAEAERVEGINELIEDDLNPRLETADDVATIDDTDDDTIDSLSSEIFDQVVAEINAHAQDQIDEDIAEDVDSSEEARKEADRIEDEFGARAQDTVDALYYAAALVDEIHDLAGDGDRDPFWRLDEDDEEDPYPDEEDFEIDRDQYDDPPEQPEREEGDSDDVEVEATAYVDEYGELTIDGTVTNVSDESIDEVVIYIDVYNPDDEYLWGDTAGVEDLDPGASEGFESGWTADEERGEVGYVETDPMVYNVVDEEEH